jgi:hypothetical protein
VTEVGHGERVKRRQSQVERELDVRVAALARRVGRTDDNEVTIKRVAPWSLKPKSAKRGKRG